MNISYIKIANFWAKNKKILIYSEIFTLIVGCAYFVLTPKLYEVYFEVNIAKIEVGSTTPLGSASHWSPVSQGRDLKRALEAPMGYSKSLIEECFGVDTNANRKNLVSSAQLGVANSGYTLSVTMRLAGEAKVKMCAEKYAQYIVGMLNQSLEDKLIADSKSPANSHSSKILHSDKAALLIPVRLADDYVRPEKLRVIGLSLIFGFLLALGIVFLNEKYRAK